MREEIFRMERVTYREQGVLLLEDFNLRIYRGEIMGMLPVNAHGLLSFLKLLQNNLPLYDGYIYYGDETVNSWKESKKTANRISVIGVQSCLVEGLSVSDNIFVLRQGFRQEIIRTRMLRKQLAPLLEDIGMEIPVDARVEELPVFERVVVEILRAVALGHRLIVLNEIGTIISYEELEKLHEILRHYTGQGFSFLYICLHHEEMIRICDRIALFVSGHIQKMIHNAELTNELILLYSREYDRMVRGHLAELGKNGEKSREILKFDRIQGEIVSGLSFSVYEGECLAVQTVDNHTFGELKEMLLGNQQPESGRIFMDAKSVGIVGNRQIAVIQELPTRTMVFPKLSYMENLCICLSERLPSIWRKRRIRSSIQQEYEKFLGEDVFSLPVEQLSERQKYQMIYMRVLLQKPKVVFCIQPFKGADMPHRMVVWEMIGMLLKHRIAVVILSLNLADSLSLADRLLVVDRNGTEKEIWRKDFASISVSAPWLYLYKESEE